MSQNRISPHSVGLATPEVTRDYIDRLLNFTVDMIQPAGTIDPEVLTFYDQVTVSRVMDLFTDRIQDGFSDPEGNTSLVLSQNFVIFAADEEAFQTQENLKAPVYESRLSKVRAYGRAVAAAYSLLPAEVVGVNYSDELLESLPFPELLSIEPSFCIFLQNPSIQAKEVGGKTSSFTLGGLWMFTQHSLENV